MKLSTKGRYGLRALLDLAIHSTNSHQTLVSIANRQGISEIYLEQVFSTLRKAGLVNSIKGAQGGYLLGDLAERIKVSTILKALEGDLSIIDEQVKSIKDKTSITYCVKVNVWDQVDYNVNSFLDSMTLADLVDDYKKLNNNESYMYNI